MNFNEKTVFEGEQYKFVSELEDLYPWRETPFLDSLIMIDKDRKLPVLSINVKNNKIVGINSKIANNTIMKTTLKDLNSFIKAEKIEVELDGNSKFKLSENGTVGFQYGLPDFELRVAKEAKKTNKLNM